MASSAVARWRGGMTFDLDLQGHRFTIDAAEESGGSNRGPRPKALLLAGLAGCTGMDVVSLLRKMHMEFDSLAVEVEADTADQHPKVYRAIRIRYLFTGDKLEREKIEKAVELSQTRYCGVSAMLAKAAPISYQIIERPTAGKP